MHPFFAPLENRELALLLTSLTVGGEAAPAVFAHLSPHEAARLNDKASALAKIPSEQRVGLMVRELKDALAFNGLRGVERVDPSWIVHGLRGESPRVVATLLISMPAAVQRSVLRRLPPAIRDALPPKQQIKAIRPELALAVRQMFEARFFPMPAPSKGPYGFHDIVHLERPELFHLVRDLGLIELGQAFVTVGRMALYELCRRLPREHAEELIHAVKVASRVDLPDDKSAQRFLSRVVVNFENTEEFLQKSGLWRLAKAILNEDASFRTVLGQRLPRRAAQHLHAYVEKATEMGDVASPEVTFRLQDAILVRIILLARQSILGPTWADVPMQYHDAAAAQLAIDESEQMPPSLANAADDAFEMSEQGEPPEGD